MTRSPILKPIRITSSVNGRTMCRSRGLHSQALKTGLELESDIGVNPYQFGVIGSTDAHTALPLPRRTISTAKWLPIRFHPERMVAGRTMRAAPLAGA